MKRLLILVLTWFAAAFLVQGANAACTEVIGFSQTLQLYKAGLEQTANGDEWQLRANGGGGISQWANPDSRFWDTRDTPIQHNCASGSDEPDRVVLTISDGVQDVLSWVTVIDAAVTTTNLKVPSAKTITLQPVVGGPDEAFCPASNRLGVVRASFNHPTIDEAIAIVAANPSIGNIVNVEVGFSPEVRNCDDYRDTTGHLTSAGNVAAGRAMGEFYSGGSTTPPDPNPDPNPRPNSCPVPEGMVKCVFLKRKGKCSCR